MTIMNDTHRGYDGLDENVIRKIKAIRLLILDVDGVMTDGRIIMDDTGREIKNFNVRDGHGLKMIQRYGIKVGILTGRKSEVVNHRAKDLEINIFFACSYLPICSIKKPFFES